MQNLFFYMLLLAHNNKIDDRMVKAPRRFGAKFMNDFWFQVKEGLDVNEAPDFMRALGFFPSDYEIECLHHELEVGGKRKIPFEDLVKLYVNHSHTSFNNGAQPNSLENAVRCLVESPTDATTESIIIKKAQLVGLLTEAGEKVDEKDAEFYLKQFFSSSNEISLKEFLQQISKISSIA